MENGHRRHVRAEEFSGGLTKTSQMMDVTGSG